MKGKKKNWNWLKLFKLDNMVSAYSLSFIASMILIVVHNLLSGLYGEESLPSIIPFFLALAAILLNTLASLYLVWHGLIRLVKK